MWADNCAYITLVTKDMYNVQRAVCWEFQALHMAQIITVLICYDRVSRCNITRQRECHMLVTTSHSPYMSLVRNGHLAMNSHSINGHRQCNSWSIVLKSFQLKCTILLAGKGNNCLATNKLLFYRYGINSFIVLSPVTNGDVLTSEAQAKLILSSVAIAIKNTGW